MIDGEGRTKLIDFGIASRPASRRLTFGATSQVMGTPDYISPEQVAGAPGDARSDIYALGVMLYEMLTGKAPFRGSNPFAIMNDRLLNNPDSASRTRAGDISRAARGHIPCAAAGPGHSLSQRREASHGIWNISMRSRSPTGRSCWNGTGGAGRSSRTAALYLGLALVPVTIFAVLYHVAGRNCLRTYLGIAPHSQEARMLLPGAPTEPLQ